MALVPTLYLNINIAFVLHIEIQYIGDLNKENPSNTLESNGTAEYFNWSQTPILYLGIFDNNIVISGILASE